MQLILLVFALFFWGCRSHTADSDGGIFSCTGPDNDCDSDGYSPPIDCDDRNPLVNPEAYDFLSNNLDDDCDGTKDNPVLVCETSGTAPIDYARAADLCAQRSKTRAGTIFDPIVRAEWGQVKGLGPGQRLWTSQTKMQQVAVATSLGMNAPRTGTTMLGLANGPWAAADPRSSAPLDDPMFKLLDACSDIPLLPDDCAALSNGAPRAASPCRIGPSSLCG